MTAARQHGDPDDKRLYLIDAMALAYRSHFIFISRPLINSKGQNTSAAYGFTNSLLKLIEDHDMQHIAVVFDVGGDGETFRSELYQDYKAHRAPPPDDLLANLPWIEEIVEALDIPVLGVPGVEADDVIGTLARQAEAEGADVVIVSPDKDFQQLLSDRISIFRPAHRGEAFDPITAERFEAEHGVEPRQFIDMLALMGDTSDNVPGVPGIGPKTAAQLIAAYGSVENLLAHAEEVKGKRAREGLLEHRDDALLSKELVTIKTDVPVDVDWHAFHRGDPDAQRLLAIFGELEFRSLAERLQKSGEVLRGRAKAAVPPEEFAGDPALSFDFGPYEPVTRYDEGAVDYRIIRTRAQLEGLAEDLAAQDRFAFDTETTSTDPMIASLVGLSFSWRAGQGRYVPTPLPDGTATGEVLEVLKPVWGGQKIAQNAKYDVVVLARHGARVEGPLFDTMVAHYLLAPEGVHNLDSLARQYLSYRMIPIADLIGTGKSQRSMRDVPVDEVGPYACEDADIALRLADILRDELDENGLLAIAETMEFPLIYVLAEMEMTGVKVDTAVLREISGQLSQALTALEKDIYEAAGEAFNINSPQQLAVMLFDRLNLPVKAKTSTGKPSTKESVLHELATEHPLPGLLLDWRKIAKLKSTYVDTLGDLVHPGTGRIHTDFNQTITATGRLSCLPSGTLVNTERGLVGIEMVQPGEHIRTPFGPRRVLAWQATGVKPTLVLRLSNGISLRCSPEHRLRSRGRWCRADTLVPGDPVYMTFAEGLFGCSTALELEPTAAYPTRRSPRLPEQWTPELAELVGYFMADGHLARSTYNGKPSKVVLAFGWDEHDLMEHFARQIEDLFEKRPTRRRTRTCPVLEISGVDIGGAFEQLGAAGRSSTLRVPPGLFVAPEPVMAAFLRGYFEGDGCVGPQYGISVRSVSRAMLEDVQQLLTLFGIPSGLSDGYPDPRGYAPRHTLRILGDRSKLTFYERIGFLSERKRRRCARLVTKRSEKSCAEWITEHVGEDVDSFAGRIPRSSLRKATDSSARYLVACREGGHFRAASFLEEAASAQYFEVTVKAVDSEPAVPMFDIAVEGVEQYTAQGLVVHNSSNPNLQNIPVRTEMGREIRKAFIPREGWKLLAADYVQIELRILASMSGDEALKQDFIEGKDIHTATAARVFKIKPEEVTRDQRRKAKEVNYGIPYGVSPWGLAQRLRTSMEEAQALIEQYQRTYPQVSRYLVQKVEEAREKGYVETLLGRRRYVPGIHARNRNDRSFAERVAVNMPIQGTQADMIKIAMVNIHRRIHEEGLLSRMLLQVHDELVFEVPPEEEPTMRAIIEQEMVHALPLDVPIEVDIDAGANWLDAH